MNNFRVIALESSEYVHLFSQSEQELKNIGAIRMTVDVNPGFPCRVSLEDAEIGDEVILLPYTHHDVGSPYRASGPIFVRKNQSTADFEVNELPAMLTRRTQSLRAYDENAMMKDARTADGAELDSVINDIFDNPVVKYIQVHNAKPGCFNCQINRV